MNHRVGRVIFAVAVGLIVATLSYRWITNPAGRIERELQVQVVEASRDRLRGVVAGHGLEIVDSLAPNRKVGKAYIYPEGNDWTVSGYYRRGDDDQWHPYLMTLDAELALIALKIQDNDPGLVRQAASDPRIEMVR
tara:strand:- start:12162 stop:12569 length:408 start_codon:yes stop_codon:yes gene_type:complete